MNELETSSPAETEGVAARLAALLAPGDLVTVAGELGAGKTTFVRGACRALGVTGPVTSPTFTVGRRYQGRLPVAHLDLHRIGGLEAEEPGLLADYLDPAGVTFVEWGELAVPDLPEPALRVALAHAGGDLRRIAVREP